MLKRVTGALFEDDVDSEVEIFVEAQGNNGTEAAKFEYDGSLLQTRTIQGHPGCSFTVTRGINQFEAVVVFDPSAPASARYDMFQVSSSGGSSSLDESVTKSQSSPLIGFGIEGIAVPVGAVRGAAPRRGTAVRPKPRRAAAPRAGAVRKRTTGAKKRKTARKKTTARKRTTAKRASRKTARKAPGSRKRR